MPPVCPPSDVVRSAQKTPKHPLKPVDNDLTEGSSYTSDGTADTEIDAGTLKVKIEQEDIMNPAMPWDVKPADGVWPFHLPSWKPGKDFPTGLAADFQQRLETNQSKGMGDPDALFVRHRKLEKRIDRDQW